LKAFPFGCGSAALRPCVKIRPDNAGQPQFWQAARLHMVAGLENQIRGLLIRIFFFLSVHSLRFYA
jgi:hypothetical protein